MCISTSSSIRSSSMTTPTPTPTPTTTSANANAGTWAIEDALTVLRAGGLVLVMDNEDRENEGDLIGVAELASPRQVAFMVRHSTGIICVPSPAERLSELQLPLMVADNTEVHKCKFTITVDLREGNTTGVSASDRARTIRALADPSVSASAFNRPGHVFPLQAQAGGVLVRAGHTEAALDLARLAGANNPLGYIGEVNDDDGNMMRRPELETFAQVHNVPLITISDLIRYRVRNERVVSRRPLGSDVATAAFVQTPVGRFQRTAFDTLLGDDQRYEVLSFGELNQARGVAVFFVGEGFDAAMHAQWAQQLIVDQFASAGGLLIYERGTQQLLEVSGELMARQSIFGVGMQIVRELGVQSVVLLTEARDGELPFSPIGFGMEIDRVQALEVPPSA